MKKTLIGTIVIGLALALAACGATGASPTASATTTGGALSTAYQDALSSELQLALGTLKLDENGVAIDNATAGVLLPLWKAVRSLSASDSTSALEMQALYQQIEESLSAEQVAAIATMRLTSSDLAQEMAGLAVDSGSGSGSTVTAAQTGAPAAGPGGDAAAPPDVNVNMGSVGGDTTGAAMAAIPAASQGSNASAAAGSAIPTAVVNAIITLLEGKS